MNNKMNKLRATVSNVHGMLTTLDSITDDLAEIITADTDYDGEDSGEKYDAFEAHELNSIRNALQDARESLSGVLE